MQDFILLFTKYPQPGTSKTRLIPCIGPEKAAALQKTMTEAVVATAQNFCHKHPCTLNIWYQGGDHNRMAGWLGKELIYKRQYGNHLGQAMFNGLRHYLGEKGKIALIGSDCPGVDVSLLSQAFSLLVPHDLVLGPAYDGGYYLIAINRNIEPRQLGQLFTGIDWGSGEVLAQTLDRAKTENLTTGILPTLHDIDRPEDLKHLNYCPDPQ